ncbi:MAG: PTS trehalose transporter subunit IIBC [Firmicutes bacterium HGW-Firmicutes-20]|jgi:sucrose PTS system EIIBCA or EIIBC component|nr:MAG: PTS trehalose transporter subunit IIBC [Firmicutes bacterium HGW-Firmicutes-20]PKM69614.1 MAG: PTS trehalose transporter subunit IIBC [Firmicutes bacterium HGW-Firmicutes-19]
MDYKKIAAALLELVGGKSNIKSNATCMTRLRITVVDESKVNYAEIKKLEGVLGIVEGTTVQTIFGPGKVTKVGEEMAKLTGLQLGSDEAGVEDVAKQNKDALKSKQQSPVHNFLRKIANIFIPLLPGIIAAGLINGLTNVINVSTGGAYNAFWWYQLIRTLGFAVFTFLPIYVGMNSAKEFGGTPIIGAIAGALSVSHAGMPLLMKIADAPILMPITNAAYNPAAGGLLAALFAGMFFATVEKQVKKVMPDLLTTFFTPLFTVIIGGFVAVIVIQPFGAVVSKGIFSALDFAYNQLGVFGGYILSAGFLPLVSVGLHQALTPIHIMLNNPEGPTQGINYLLPILMMAGGGQVGAGLALYVRTKNLKLKRMTRDSLPIGILGIGEPMMYAVTLPLGRPFITACLGAGVGGVLASIFKLGAITQGVSGLFGLLIVQPGNQFAFIIAMLGAYAGGFVLTYFFGYDEKRVSEIYGE